MGVGIRLRGGRLGVGRLLFECGLHRKMDDLR